MGPLKAFHGFKKKKSFSMFWQSRLNKMKLQFICTQVPTYDIFHQQGLFTKPRQIKVSIEIIPVGISGLAKKIYLLQSCKVNY